MMVINITAKAGIRPVGVLKGDFKMSMSPIDVSKELRLISKKHKGLPTDFGAIRISDMADSAANAIDELLIFTDRITELSSCKTCAVTRCQFKPASYEEVRYNCHLYRPAKTRYPDIDGVGPFDLKHLEKETLSAESVEELRKLWDSEVRTILHASEPCIHCNGGHALIIIDDNDRGIAIQHPNRLVAFGYDPNGTSSNGVSCLINYCPMCGVKVGGAS